MATLKLGEPMPHQEPVACQSVIGEGIGKPRASKDNPQWKLVASQEQTTRSPPQGTTVARDKNQAAESPQLRVMGWWLSGWCSHWWMVLWGLLLAAVWPTASYVLTGWDCANPTHVTAYNKDRMCSQEPLHQEVPLGHEVHILQQVKIWETTGYSCQLTVSQWTFR